MRVLYFNIYNGECVKPFTVLPSHRAFITGSKIHMIEVCFSVSNITNYGFNWFQNQVEKEFKDWDTYEHLMQSLKKLAFKETLKHPFKYSNFKARNHRFPFVPVWIEGMKYDEFHFEDVK